MPDRVEQKAPWRDPHAVPYIRIEGVSKQFGDFIAVNNVSLDVYQGEIFCLLGGSGCGKTTLLRMLAGFEVPSAGRISIDGADMAAVPPYERPVNMMFQSYALFPHMSVEQNIAFGLKQEGLPRGEIESRVAEMLAIVKLGEFAKRKPHQLSGGQRQRVALARSLVKRPKLLLLDEPLGALDKKLREHTQFELVNIQERLGVTFIVVTHDQEEAMTLASRIGVMNQGRIVQHRECRAWRTNLCRSWRKRGARGNGMDRHTSREAADHAAATFVRLQSCQRHDQGNRLHGRHVDLSRAARVRQDSPYHTAEYAATCRGSPDVG